MVGFEQVPPARIHFQNAGKPNAEPTAYTIQDLEDIISRMQEVYLLIAGLNVVLEMDYVRRFGETPPRS